MGRTICIAVALLALAGCRGKHEGPGSASSERVPKQDLAARAAAQTAVREGPAAGGMRAPAAKQILFGDLHVHTTFSADAFVRSLPMLQGDGAHPPADACDFARFCSALDFWSINDHAEAISPQHWRETKQAIRECNAPAGGPPNPEMRPVPASGGPQGGAAARGGAGATRPRLSGAAPDDKAPKGPIGALDRTLVGALRRRPTLWQRLRFPILACPTRQRYFDFGEFKNELAAVPTCPAGV